MKDCNALTNLLHILMPYALLPQALQAQGPKLTIYGGGGVTLLSCFVWFSMTALALQGIRPSTSPGRRQVS